MWFLHIYFHKSYMSFVISCKFSPKNYVEYDELKRELPIHNMLQYRLLLLVLKPKRDITTQGPQGPILWRSRHRTQKDHKDHKP